MRFRDLLKKFRLAFPVFGILLGSCSGSLNLPTMNRKNALPDGYSSFSVGLVASSIYFGVPSVETSGAGWCFNISIDGNSVTFLSSGSSNVVYINSATYSILAPYVLNASDFTFTSGALNFGEGYNTDCVLYFSMPYTITNLYSRFNEVSGEVGVPSGDLYLTGYSVGYSAGDSVGYSNGYAEGNSVGYSEGYSAGFEGASLVEQTINVTCADGSGYNIFNYSVSLDGVVTSTGVIDSGYRNGLKVTRDPSKVLSITFTYVGDSNLRCIPSVSGNDELIVLPTFLQVDGVYYLPYWWATVDIELKSTTAPDFPTSPVFTLDNSAIEQVLIGYSYREITDARTEGYTSGYDVGYTEGYDSGYYEMSVIADSEIAQTSTQAYNDGRASVGTEETAITNLLGSIVSVPISVLNGLMPLAIWNTPIISILVTLMVVALVLWLVRVLI